MALFGCILQDVRHRARECEQGDKKCTLRRMGGASCRCAIVGYSSPWGSGLEIGIERNNKAY